MTSAEKLRALLAAIRDAEPETEEDARQLAILGTIAPLAIGNLPDEPGELDALLLRGAAWAMQLRSDEAELPSIAELLDHPTPGPVAIEGAAPS